MSNRRTKACLWCAIRALKEFRARDLEKICQVDVRTVRRYCRQLVVNNYLSAEVERPSYKEQKNFYRLINDTGGLPPSIVGGKFVDPNLQTQATDMIQRLWVTMLAVKRFSINDLMSLSKASRTYCDRYVKLLKQAGYVEVFDPALHRKAPVIYELVKATGPQAPIMMADDTIFDPNSFLQKLQQRRKN